MYENINYEDIKKSILDNIDTDIDKREGSFTNDMISPAAFEIYKSYLEFEKMLSVIFVNDCSGEYLDKRVIEYGLKRKEGSVASGIVRFYGNDNTTIASETIVQTGDMLVYRTLLDGTIKDGYADIKVESDSIGNKYNVPPAAINSIPISLIGITKVSNIESINGGSDIENDDSLTGRFLNQVRNPSTSGNIAHYRQWALTNEGVGEVVVIPIWNGPGTVKIIIVDRDKGPAKQELVNEVKNYIESVRPIGATATVVSARGVNVNITAKLTLSRNANLENINIEFSNKLLEYFKKISIVSNSIFYSKIGSILSGIEGVIDYNDLLINNKTSNLTLDNEEVPIIGAITLT